VDLAKFSVEQCVELVQLGRIEAVVALLGGHALVGVPSGFQQFASKLYHKVSKMNANGYVGTNKFVDPN
jgi:hypothetical protein